MKTGAQKNIIIGQKLSIIGKALVKVPFCLEPGLWWIHTPFYVPSLHVKLVSGHQEGKAVRCLGGVGHTPGDTGSYCHGLPRTRTAT